MERTDYLLDNAAPEASQRFDALAALFNPASLRHLLALGLASGWHCWEVGAGGPTIPRWLGEQVGPTGRVLATDINISLAQSSASATVEVRCHNLESEPPPDERFDLIHARLLLTHLPRRETALRTLTQALMPGGWLLVEDGDPGLQPLSSLEERGPADLLANRLRAATRQLLEQRGTDLAFGRKLPRLLRETGLQEVGADAFFVLSHPACIALERATITMLQEALIAQSLATSTEIGDHLANLDARRIEAGTSPLVSAWGRRP